MRGREQKNIASLEEIGLHTTNYQNVYLVNDIVQKTPTLYDFNFEYVLPSRIFKDV